MKKIIEPLIILLSLGFLLYPPRWLFPDTISVMAVLVSVILCLAALTSIFFAVRIMYVHVVYKGITADKRYQTLYSWWYGMLCLYSILLIAILWNIYACIFVGLALWFIRQLIQELSGKTNRERMVQRWEKEKTF